MLNWYVEPQLINLKETINDTDINQISELEAADIVCIDNQISADDIIEHFSCHRSVILLSLDDLSSHDLEKIIDAAKANYVLFMLGMPQCFHPLIKVMIKESRNQVIGDIRKIEITYTDQSYAFMNALIALLKQHALIDEHQLEMSRAEVSQLRLIGTHGEMHCDYNQLNALDLLAGDESLTATSDIDGQSYLPMIEEVNHCIAYIRYESEWMSFDVMRSIIKLRGNQHD